MQTNGATRIHIALLTGLLIAFSIELFIFARIQDLWVDETTQLSGIRLDFWEMLRWLGGVDIARFGVPGDRMPPFSYVLDWLWLRLSGPSELGFRLFHGAFVVAGVAILAALALRRIGAWGAAAVVAFAMLSPKLIETGVEIRAYPIFFAITCAQIVVFLRLADEPRKVHFGELSLFVVISIVAGYTHFYGLISSCAFTFALGIAFIRSRASLLALIGAFAVMAVFWAGLWPIIFSSVKMSTVSAPNDVSRGQYVAYLFRLLGTSANGVSITATALFFGGAIALLLAGAIAASARAVRGAPLTTDWLFLAVIAGVAAPIMANSVVRTFSALNASYSGWLFAPLALLVAVGATSRGGLRAWDKIGRFAMFAAVLIGAALSTGEFFAHASEFTHGPRRFVGAIYDATASPEAIVYEPGAEWGFSYFPLVFTYDSRVVQYRAVEDGAELIPINVRGDPAAGRDLEQEAARYRNILLVNIQSRTFRDLRACQDKLGTCPGFDPSRIEPMMIATGRWKEAKVLRSFGIYDTRVVVMERVDSKPSPD